jgi:hypothetical protein
MGRSSKEQDNPKLNILVISIAKKGYYYKYSEMNYRIPVHIMFESNLDRNVCQRQDSLYNTSSIST